MKTLKLLSLALALTGLTQTLPPPAQAEPLRLELTDGVIEPMTFAVPTFQAETSGASDLANKMPAWWPPTWPAPACFARSRQTPSSRP